MAKTITLRLDEGTYDTLKRAASGDRRTISNFIEYAAIHFILNNNTVDGDEMSEILVHKKDLKKGLTDIKNGRYRIIG